MEAVTLAQVLKGVAVVQGVDVQSDDQVAGMAEALAAEGGGPFDIVLNNAGPAGSKSASLGCPP